MYNTIFTPSIWFLLGILIIFLFGALMHFVYNWTGNSTLIGIFAPVNESVWEHLKLSTYPTFLWYIIGFLLFKDKINVHSWFTCCGISVIISALVIVAFYYTHTGAFGIHSLALDIFSLFLGILIAQCLSLHIYNYANISALEFSLSTIVSLLIIVAFTKFTFTPPKFPIFMDPITGQYGIQK